MVQACRNRKSVGRGLMTKTGAAAGKSESCSVQWKFTHRVQKYTESWIKAHESREEKVIIIVTLSAV